MSLVPVAVLDWPAGPDTRAQWAGLVAGAGIEEEALEAEQEMTNRHCRLAELLRQVRTGTESDTAGLSSGRRSTRVRRSWRW